MADKQLALNPSGDTPRNISLGVNELIKAKIPSGGSTGETLVKVSDDSYDVSWGAASGSGASYTDEDARDAIAAFIQNGTGITWVHNDPANTLTGTVSLASFSTTNLSEGSNLYYLDERVDDRVAALIQNGTGITWTYNDAANTLTPTVTVTPGLALLEQHTASSSATLDFTTAISATYDEYLIEFVNVVPATNAVDLWMRMSTDGGSTYDSGTNYSYLAIGTNRFGQAVNAVDSGGAKIIMNGSVIDNTSTAGVNGTFRLKSPGSTSVHKNVHGEHNTLVGGGTLEVATSDGWYRSTTAVNAFRFLFSSGSIASGIIRVFGIAK